MAQPFLFEVPQSFIDPGIESHLLLVLSLFKIVLNKPTLEPSIYEGVIPAESVLPLFADRLIKLAS